MAAMYSAEAIRELNEQCLCEVEPMPLAGAQHQSNHPFFVSRSHDTQIRDFIACYNSLTQHAAFRSQVASWLPGIVRHPVANPGVFDGYDFHLTETGPKLIEVNTNAGGGYLSVADNTACSCDLMASPMQTNYERRIVAMFQQEYALYNPDTPLRTLVILDDAPTGQFLYPEMQALQRLFIQQGINTLIASPEDLVWRNNKLLINEQIVDLVYNRHTDFYLQTPAMETVKTAYLSGGVVLTPHPAAYGFRADKRLLAYLSDETFLQDMGLNQHEIRLVSDVIPVAKLVTPANADDLWRQRKHWFFKPASGHGSKGVYKGAKLTKKTWQMIVANDYVAQQYVEPSRRGVSVQGQRVPLKADLRHYVYNGETLHRLARLYSGQATNMRTPAGGFSQVVVLD